MNFVAQHSIEPSERGILTGTVRVVLVYWENLDSAEEKFDRTLIV